MKGEIALKIRFRGFFLSPPFCRLKKVFLLQQTFYLFFSLSLSFFLSLSLSFFQFNCFLFPHFLGESFFFFLYVASSLLYTYTVLSRLSFFSKSLGDTSAFMYRYCNVYTTLTSIFTRTLLYLLWRPKLIKHKHSHIHTQTENISSATFVIWVQVPSM